MKKKIKIILFGAGGHALSVIDVIEKTKKFKILFLLDKFDGEIGKYKIYKEKKNIEYYKKYTNKAFVSIGQIKNSKPRSILYNKLLEKGFIIPKIISPFALVSDTAKIDDGTIVMHHALVNSFSQIGKNCIINSKALVEHGVKIENNCHLSTGSIANGDCLIKTGSFIGSNATIIQKITIGSNSVVGAGKIVKKNLPINSVYK